MLTQIERNLDSTEEEDAFSRSVLESIQWDRPPDFRRTSRDDPRRKWMMEEVRGSPQLFQDPYYMTRIFRHQNESHPFVFIRAMINDFELEDGTETL
jgi:hypothetical protein